MGRKTWESIPAKFRPLKDRLNVVLTKSPESLLKDEVVPENLMVMSDFEEALVKLSNDSSVGEIFIIGGSSLYEDCFGKYAKHCKLVLATRINKKFECDTFVPSLEKESPFTPLHISQTQSQDDITFDFVFYGNTELLAK